jgi:hypothetical protein
LRERFDAGTGLVALGAVLLLVSLFVDWFAPSGDAWAVFELTDIVLAAAAGVCLVAIVPRYTGLARAVPALAFGALIVVAVQLVDAPPGARGDRIESGAWLALAASALMAIGATLSAASISVTIDVRGRDRRRRTAAIDAREREAREAREAAAAAAAEESEPVTGTEARRARRRAGAGAAAAAGGPAGAVANDAAAPPDEPRRTRRPAEESAPAPHAADPPTAPDPGPGPAADPDRTQTLEPIDRPPEAS